MGFITRIGWAAVLAVVMVLEGVPGADGAFQGDPVQTFKRMRFGDQRTVWSDVLVGQGPLFDVDRAVELHLPTADNFMETTAVKLQLSYDNEKHVSEWLTLSDGAGLMLDTLTVHFVHAGGAIKEIHHQQHFLKSPDGSHPPPHQKTITIAYKWVPDEETDTRGALNFLFVGGFLLTLFAVTGALFDSQDLLSSRALLVPEYEEGSGRKRPVVKNFVLYQPEEVEGIAPAPEDEEGRATTNAEGLSGSQGMRLRGGGDQEAEEGEEGGGGDTGSKGKGDWSKGKGD